MWARQGGAGLGEARERSRRCSSGAILRCMLEQKSRRREKAKEKFMDKGKKEKHEAKALCASAQ